MEKWQLGDITSFEKLFQKYEKLVFRNAYFITGSRDQAEDIVQEVFLAVWRYRETFNPAKAKFTTWLQRITVNECTRKHKENNNFDSFNELDFPEIASRQPEEILVTKSAYESLFKMLKELEKKHRSVVVLKYLNDLSYSEIAEVLDIPVGTVKSRLSRAVTCLKVKLALEKGRALEMEEEHGL